ncbi:MAG: hypothetical protein QXS54_06510 [Candidatus Methanomethylicaceae archaeon]
MSNETVNNLFSPIMSIMPMQSAILYAFVRGVSSIINQGLGNRAVLEGLAAAFAHASEIALDKPVRSSQSPQAASINERIGVLATTSSLLGQIFQHYGLISPATVSAISEMMLEVVPSVQSKIGQNWERQLGFLLKMSVEEAESSREGNMGTDIILAHSVAYGSASPQEKFNLLLKVKDPGWAGIAASALVLDPRFSTLRLSSEQQALVLDALLNGILRAGEHQHDIHRALVQWLAENHTHPSLQIRIHTVADAVDSLTLPYARRLGHLLNEKGAKALIAQLGTVMKNSENVKLMFQGAHLPPPFKHYIPWRGQVKKLLTPFFYAPTVAFNLKAHLADATHIRDIGAFDDIVGAVKALNEHSAMNAALFGFALLAAHQVLPNQALARSTTLKALATSCGLSEKDAQTMLQAYDNSGKSGSRFVDELWKHMDTSSHHHAQGHGFA